MKLHEIAHRQLTYGDIAHIEDWLYEWKIKVGTYDIDPYTGVVNVNSDVNLNNMKNVQVLPVRFGKVTGRFDCALSSLTTLKGCPHTVGNVFTCAGTDITSLVGAPTYVGNSFYCHDTHITSLAGVSKYFTKIGGEFYCSNIKLPDKLPTHVLGLILIPHLQIITLGSGIDNIMNKHLGSGDILACQDELIDAGFVQQARL
jgi:hypothetical protein